MGESGDSRLETTLNGHWHISEADGVVLGLEYDTGCSELFGEEWGPDWHCSLYTTQIRDEGVILVLEIASPRKVFRLHLPSCPKFLAELDRTGKLYLVPTVAVRPRIVAGLGFSRRLASNGSLRKENKVVPFRRRDIREEGRHS